VFVETGFRLDILADECVIIELKSIETIAPIHEAQLLTDLKLANVRLGFILNFNVPLMKQGIKRMVI
jgi:GxxExxY protein